MLNELVSLRLCSSSEYSSDEIYCVPDSYRKFKEKRVAQNPAASEVKVWKEALNYLGGLD